jgi:hypothetical protein
LRDLGIEGLGNLVDRVLRDKIDKTPSIPKSAIPELFLFQFLNS